MLPEGTYLAKPTGGGFGRSSNGNEQIAVTFEIVEGSHAGTNIVYVGTFTEKATKYTLEALRNLDWKSDDLSEIPALAHDGKLSPAEIVVEHEVYKDKTTAKVRYVNRPGQGRFAFKEKLEGDELKRFAAQMKSQVGGAARKDPNDIPF